MTDLEALKNELMKNPEFQAEYEALAPEYEIIQAMIDARHASGLTQKELAERTGIAQGDISKLEKGNANPSLKTLLVVGNADITVPTQQTLDMERALIARYGAENVRLDLFDGAIHADDSMYTDEYLAKVESYIREALK